MTMFNEYTEGTPLEGGKEPKLISLFNSHRESVYPKLNEDKASKILEIPLFLLHTVETDELKTALSGEFNKDGFDIKSLMGISERLNEDMKNLVEEAANYIAYMVINFPEVLTQDEYGCREKTEALDDFADEFSGKYYMLNGEDITPSEVYDIFFDAV